MLISTIFFDEFLTIPIKNSPGKQSQGYLGGSSMANGESGRRYQQSKICVTLRLDFEALIFFRDCVLFQQFVGIRQ